jgi:hypothetical protein
VLALLLLGTYLVLQPFFTSIIWADDPVCDDLAHLSAPSFANRR